MVASHHSPAESYTGIDRRMVAATRFVLAISALAIIFIDPTEPDRLVYETYSVMLLYTLYSLYVFLTIQFDRKLPLFIERHSWWIDTASYLVLISLSSGTNSIFFFFFFFAILTAAFARGFRTGFSVVLVSTTGFWVISLFTTPADTDFDLSPYLLRPLSLLIFGYMVSSWGGYENRSLRRLELLRQIGVLSNPRFGVDRTINVNLELIRDFYNADGCLSITSEVETGALELRRVTRDKSHDLQIMNADSDIMATLTAPPDDIAGVYLTRDLARGAWGHFKAFDCVGGSVAETGRQPFMAIAEMMDAASLLTCPIYYRNQSIGRFFVYTSNVDAFDKSDLTFLLHAIDHFIPIVENIRLVDQMASDSAEQERKRIARDIHDSIIQPYIGLKLGIESLSHFVDNGDSQAPRELEKRLGKLGEMAEQGIDDLRSYVHGLSRSSDSSSVLHEALVRFAKRFSDSTGIIVVISCPQNLHLGDRLAAEVFQLIAEALSNIRRHTTSETAAIRLAVEHDRLVVEVSNVRDGLSPGEFLPKTISSRCESLGGVAMIVNRGKETKVKVTIPL